MSQISSFRTGGPASTLIEVSGPEDHAQLASYLGRSEDGHFWVLGDGSNLLVSDDGVTDPVIQMTGGQMSLTAGGFIHADAGVNWDHLVELSCRHGLFGLEKLSGIPGTVGAAPVQNIAAYGQSVSDSIAYVDVLLPSSGIERWTNEQCAFGYRSSTFKQRHNPAMVVGVGFELAPFAQDSRLYRDLATELGQDSQGRLSPGELRHAVLAVRHRKRMTWHGIPRSNIPKNAGSFFISPRLPADQALAITSTVMGSARAESFLNQHGTKLTDRGDIKVSAAIVLLACGFANGDRWGPVALPMEHVLAVTNIGGATSEQIQAVASVISERALTEFGVELEQEPRTIGTITVSDRVRRDVERSYEPAPPVNPTWITTH